jgi:hypothetical protein
MTKKFIMKYNFIKETLKDKYLNQILEKIGKGDSISKGEKEYLDNYESKNFSPEDFSHLSTSQLIYKIEELLKNENVVYCDLYDKNGKIGIKINHTEYKEDGCVLILKNGEKVKLQDNLLYNIYYIVKENKYSLQQQDEYYEKISVKNDY